MAKIRNQYNQVPYLTQDTTWKSDENTIKHYKQEPRGQPFPSRWPQGSNDWIGGSKDHWGQVIQRESKGHWGQVIRGESKRSLRSSRYLRRKQKILEVKLSGESKDHWGQVIRRKQRSLRSSYQRRKQKSQGLSDQRRKPWSLGQSYQRRKPRSMGQSYQRRKPRSMG